jgi:hypothetical protein
MRRAWPIAAAAAALAVAASPAAAQTPAPPLPGQPPPGQPQPQPPPQPPANEQPDRITITAVFKTIVFGEPGFISGRFRHLPNPEAEEVPYRDKTLTLEEAPHPFAQFTPIATTVTDRDGWYSFKITPGLNSRYRVRSTDPPVESDDKIVRVRFKASMRISDRSPRQGQRITISGAVSPERDGERLFIECRRPGAKRYRVVARARLRNAGSARSAYQARVRAGRSCEFRARMPGDAANLPNALGKPQPVRVR